MRIFHARLHASGGVARADEIRRCASPKQQIEGADDDRLSGACLAREDNKTRGELDFEPVDHRQILDAEEPDHARRLS